jgi:hypothetical protein
MLISRAYHVLLLVCLACHAGALAARQLKVKPYEDDAPLQDIVTWDEHSVFINGQRLMLFNGEFHPFRLPVQSLWLDIFQKLRAAGFTGVSFYADWVRPPRRPLAMERFSLSEHLGASGGQGRQFHRRRCLRLRAVLRGCM